MVRRPDTRSRWVKSNIHVEQDPLEQPKTQALAELTASGGEVTSPVPAATRPRGRGAAAAANAGPAASRKRARVATEKEPAAAASNAAGSKKLCKGSKAAVAAVVPMDVEEEEKWQAQPARKPVRKAAAKGAGARSRK